MVDAVEPFGLEVQQPGMRDPMTLLDIAGFEVRDDGVLVVRDAPGKIVALFAKGGWTSAAKVALFDVPEPDEP